MGIDSPTSRLLPSDDGREVPPQGLQGGVQTPKALMVDDILNFIGFGPFQIVAFCVASASSFAVGLEIVAFAFMEIPLRREWGLSGLQYAILPAATGVTNIIGGFAYGYLSDNFGRIWPYALAVLNVGVFGFAAAFSPNYVTLVVLRGLASLGVTGVSVILYPTLIETLPIRNRGKVLILVLLIQAVGNCLTGGLAWWLIPTYMDNGWRYLLIALAIPNFFTAAFRMIFYVQSPRYLLARGRFKEAKKVFEVMARFNGKNLDLLLPEDHDFEDSIKLDTQKRGRKWDSVLMISKLFKPAYVRQTLCLSIIFVTEIGGFFGSSIFLPSVLEKLGLSNPYFAAFVGFLGQIPGILLMSIIVEWEHVGRIKSLRLFSALTVIAFLLLAFVQTPVATSVLTVLLYFSMQPMIPLLFAYASESYPTEIRSVALGFLANVSSFFAIFLPFLGGYIADVSASWLYPTVWAGVFFVQFIVSLFLRHETFQTNLRDV